MPDFVHLHLHSQYSLVDGAIRLPDLVKGVQARGMSAVAVTDHGNMYGAVDFYKRAQKGGVKPIFGCEAYVADGPREEKNRSFHLVLLAKNQAGFANLRKLISFGALQGMYRGRPRVDLDLLRAHSEGLIGLSACLAGQVARSFLDSGEDAARATARTYREIFAPGDFYLEVQPNGMGDQDRVNAAWRRIGRDLEIPLVATNDSHYLNREDARAHEVLMCIGMGKTLDDPNRLRHEVDAYWLKPPEVMWRELGGEFADALENTVKIADACNVEMKLGDVFLPNFEVPPGYTIDSFMIRRAEEGLDRRFTELAAIGKRVDKAAYRARLTMELEIIKGMGFPGYFMIVQDFINWAKIQGIPVGPGRGSGAGSLVAYALRITDIDPIPYNLLFERFLNPERVSMPDFDVDFCMNRRMEVIDYVTQKYGADNVGMIATFGGLKARGVLKDVGRVLGMTYAERDKLSKLVPEVLGITLAQAIEQEPRLRQAGEEDQRVQDLLDISLKLEGLLKSTGMHAAGVVIGEKPLWDYCPVFKGQNGEMVTQFAKEEVEEAGLVKFDFLGLKTLTVIDDAVRMINRSCPADQRLDLNTKGLDDPAVYALISRGDTEGVFQLESSGFREMLTKLKPDCFEDIVAAVALYRPGPMGTGMHNEFINRKHGRTPIIYPHESLAGILKDTYGVIVYQEQVMQIAQEMAGFSLGGADLLRRAMGKKKASVMAEQRKVFVEGAQARGISEAKAAEVFDLMETFAQYGFNKSHSAAYALLTYQTAYLKTFHKVAFMASLLTNDRDNADKVAKGIRNTRKIGIEVLPPSVNESQESFDAVGGKILFGMGGIKGVGSMAVESIIAAREEGGRFTSFDDFCERVDLKRVNKKTLEALIKTGAFDFCGQPRARLMASIDVSVERAQKIQRDRASGQSSLFGLFEEVAAAPEPAFSAALMRVEEWPLPELLSYEKEALGFYVSGHPLDRFEALIKRFTTTTIEALERQEPSSRVTVAGVQSGARIIPLKSGKGRMGVIQLEGLTGTVEVVAMGETLDRYEALLTSDEPLLISGALKIDKDEGGVRISIRLGQRGRRGGGPVSEGEERDVISLQEIRAERSELLQLEVDAAQLNEGRLEALKRLMSEEVHQGRCQARLKIKTPQRASVWVDLPSARLKPSDDLTHALRQIFSGAVQLEVS